MRRDRHNYYLDIAERILDRGTCLRRNYGSVIVKNDEIIATGYAGAPRGRANCIDIGECRRTKMNIPRGERYELCRSVHSEANAIISASRKDMLGAILYISGIESGTGQLVENCSPCAMCRRLIINAGISTVIVRDTKDLYRVLNVGCWITEDESLTDQQGY